MLLLSARFPPAPGIQVGLWGWHTVPGLFTLWLSRLWRSRRVGTVSSDLSSVTSFVFCWSMKATRSAKSHREGEQTPILDGDCYRVTMRGEPTNYRHVCKQSIQAITPSLTFTREDATKKGQHFFLFKADVQLGTKSWFRIAHQKVRGLKQRYFMGNQCDGT